MEKANTTPTLRLAAWVANQCNDDWEHTYGIAIKTLDNPGWHLRIELIDTELEGQIFRPIKIERSGTNWIHCDVHNGVFEGFGGNGNLDELITAFLDWAGI